MKYTKYKEKKNNFMDHSYKKKIRKQGWSFTPADNLTGI